MLIINHFIYKANMLLFTLNRTSSVFVTILSSWIKTKSEINKCMNYIQLGTNSSDAPPAVHAPNTGNTQSWRSEMTPAAQSGSEFQTMDLILTRFWRTQEKSKNQYSPIYSRKRRRLSLCPHHGQTRSDDTSCGCLWFPSGQFLMILLTPPPFHCF